MPNHRVSWHAHTYTHTYVDTYIYTRYRYIYLSRTCERKSALRRARDRDISTGRGLGEGGLISCNGDETNVMEHEGRHEAKFSAEGHINRTLLLGNIANHTAKITILFTESRRELRSRDRLYSETDYAQRNPRMACMEHMHVRRGY